MSCQIFQFPSKRCLTSNNTSRIATGSEAETHSGRHSVIAPQRVSIASSNSYLRVVHRVKEDSNAAVVESDQRSNWTQ